MFIAEGKFLPSTWKQISEGEILKTIEVKPNYILPFFLKGNSRQLDEKITSSLSHTVSSILLKFKLFIYKDIHKLMINLQIHFQTKSFFTFFFAHLLQAKLFNKKLPVKRLFSGFP